MNTLDKYTALDRRLIEIAKNIKVLRNLSWPAHVATGFLEQWTKNGGKLPEVIYERKSYQNEKLSLKEISAACDGAHPIGRYIKDTAESYLAAAEMLERAGTPDFTSYSARIYGMPRDCIGSTKITNLEAAEHFIKSTDEFTKACPVVKADICVMPDHVASEMRRLITPVFKHHSVEVVVDRDLASKAAASASRIRIRGFTCFSPMDLPQLVQHEAFVHTLSMLNGREQPNLKSLGLGAPRTTRTQEGLALFAELITTCIDINRLRRIALRVKAIDMAVQGADFLDVFRFFLSANQDEIESFQSAARIFRGGDPRGGVVFTKDVVYLAGLIYTHTFLHKAIHLNKLDYPHYIFSGRLTFRDVIELEPFFKSGYLASPIYEPEWITQRECLTAFLSYSVFSNRIDLGKIELSDFTE